VQNIKGQSSRWSGLFAAGPLLGVSVPAEAKISAWGEVQLSAAAYRVDRSTAASFVPAGWLGVSFAP
jgi:hypothetical protein